MYRGPQATRAAEIIILPRISNTSKSTFVLFLLLLSIAAFEITISYSMLVNFTETGLKFDKDEILLPIKYANIIVGVICGFIAWIMPKNRSLNYVKKMLPFIFLGAFGVIIGWLHDNKMHGFLSHIYNHGLLLTYSYAAYKISPYLLEVNIQKIFGRLATALLLVTTGFIVYTYANGIDWKYSLNYITLLIPAAYFIVTKQTAIVGLIMLLALATGKRGMMLAIFSTALLYYWIGNVRVEKKVIANLFKTMLVLTGVAVLVVGLGKWDELVDKVLENTEIRFEFLEYKDTANQIREATSGRDIEIGAIYERLNEDNSLLTGGGFGAEYTIKEANYWTKTGSDVSLFHYWLQYGYLFGTALFLYLTVILYRTIKNMKYIKNSNDNILLYSIVAVIYTIQCINNLSSFMTADPLLGLTLGLIFGLEKESHSFHRTPRRSW